MAEKKRGKKRSVQHEESDAQFSSVAIPFSIFKNKEVSAFEAICKYLKEHEQMTYHDIAEILGRDERTIWATYHNAVKKRKGPLPVSSGVSIPSALIRDREFSVLETLTSYLKNRGFSYAEIGDMLNRDPRNMYTVYTRAIEKGFQPEIPKEAAQPGFKSVYPLMLFALSLVIISVVAVTYTFFYNQSILAGYSVQQQVQEFSNASELVVSSSQSDELSPSVIGELKSVKVSGFIEGQGIARIYLDSRLIFEGSEGNFTDSCAQTCSLENLTSSSYSLHFEVENATLHLTNLTYSLLPEQLLNETAPENITSENTSEQIPSLPAEEPALNETAAENATASVNESFVIPASEFELQHDAVLGKPVKWSKTITLSSDGKTKTEIPSWATNIIVKKKAAGTVKIAAVSEGISDFNEEISASVKENKLKKKFDIEIPAAGKEFVVEYETPAPEKQEQDLQHYRKRIEIFTQHEDLHYADISASTSVDEIVPVGRERAITLFNIVNESRIPVSFNAIDNDGNGFIDTLEWIVPHLSNESYETAITLINVQSYPTLGGNWSVFFNTTGEADLTVTAINGTTWDYQSDSCGAGICEMRFENITCNNSILAHEWMQNSPDGTNNSVFYGNYSCSGIGSETSTILGPANHTLKFQFGTDRVYAFNQVIGRNVPASDIALAPVSNNTFILAWINSTGNDAVFQVFYTNGTKRYDPVTVEATVGNISRVALAMINETSFMIGWTNNAAGDDSRRIYNISGNAYTAVTDGDAGIGSGGYEVALASYMPNMNISYCYIDITEGDWDLRQYNSTSTATSSEVQIDANTLVTSTLQNKGDCIGVNDTLIAAAWYDETANGVAADKNISFSRYTGTLAKLGGTVNIDASAGLGAQVALATLNDNRIVIAYYDAADQDITINIRNTDAANILAATDIETSAGTNETRIAVAVISNNTDTDLFAVVWYNQATAEIRAEVYTNAGAQVGSTITVANSSLGRSNLYPLIAATGKESNGNSLCPNTFMVAWVNSTHSLNAQGFYVNGSEWKGTCDSDVVVDTTAPFVELEAPANTSVNYSSGSIDFMYNATDTYGLDNCTLFLNGTVNNTNATVNAGQNNSIMVNGIAAGAYNWSIGCRDPSNNYNVTGNYSLTLVLPPSTTPASDITIAPISNTQYVIAWINATANNTLFQVYYSNGTPRYAPVIVDADVGNNSRIGLAMINSTAFMIGWTNMELADDLRAIYNISGTALLAETTGDAAIGTSGYELSLTAFAQNKNITYCYIDQTEGDWDLRQYNSTSTATSTETNVDAATLATSSRQNKGDCIDVNDTMIATVWYDETANAVATDKNISFARYRAPQTKVGNTIAADASSGLGAQVTATVLNDSNVLFAFYDAEDQDITINIIDADGNNILAATDIETDAGTNLTRIDSTAVNNGSLDMFVVVWYNQSSAEIVGKAFTSTGTQVGNAFTVDSSRSSVYPIIAAAGEGPNGISLCQGKFIVSWVNETNILQTRAMDIDGNDWDGSCDFQAPFVELEAPANNSINVSNSSIDFTYNATDDSFIENCTLYLNGTANSTNTTVTLGQNNTFNVIGLPIGAYNWSVSCTDSVGNSNVTGNFTLTLGNRIDSLNATLDIVDAATETIDYETMPQQGVKDAVLKNGTSRLAYLVINFSAAAGNFNWSDVLAEVNTSAARSVVHIPAGHPEVLDKRLYIYDKRNTQVVFICPNAVSLTDVNETCTGKYLATANNVSNYYNISINSSGGGETNLTGCLNITTAGSYILNSSITNSGFVSCINVSVSDVDFSCLGGNNWIDGTDITAPNTSGIKVEGLDTSKYSNITIKNCNVTDWMRGIHFDNTQNSSIDNTTLQGNAGQGVFVNASISNNFTGIISSSNSWQGIQFLASSNSTLSNLAIQGNALEGIMLFNQSQQNTLLNIVSSQNLDDGVQIELHSRGNNLTNVTSRNNSASGFVLSTNADNTLLLNVSSLNNSQNGISMSNEYRSQILNSTIMHNKQHGIRIDNASYSNITRNAIANNSVSGFSGIFIRTQSASSNSSLNRFGDNIINNTALSGGSNFLTQGQNFTNYFNATSAAGRNILNGSSLAGNYWSDYSGSDSDGDDMGDTAHILNTTFMRDFLPLVIPSFPVSGNLSAIASQVPIESSILSVSFSFTAVHSAAASRFNDSTATANFTLIYGTWSEAVRQNVSCRAEADIDAFTANYSCIIGVWYYDAPATWNISFLVKDNSSKGFVNTSGLVQLQAITGVTINPGNVTFLGLHPLETNMTANQAINMTNTGNTNVSKNNTRIAAVDLAGIDAPAFKIFSDNFTAASASGGSGANLIQCERTAQNGSSAVLVNGTIVSIPGSLLTRANQSAGSGANQSIYVCISMVASNLTGQAYSTTGTQAWTISVV